MALGIQVYPVLCQVNSSRKVVLSAMDVYEGYPLMADDSDSGQAAALVNGDDADRFLGISMQTIYNASDLQGADGTVFVRVCNDGAYIAELDTTPAKADLHKPVFADGDTDKVSLTESQGGTASCIVGIIEAWENVEDPFGRTNAVRVRFSPTIAESIAAGT